MAFWEGECYVKGEALLQLKGFMCLIILLWILRSLRHLFACICDKEDIDPIEDRDFGEMIVGANMGYVYSLNGWIANGNFL